MNDWKSGTLPPKSVQKTLSKIKVPLYQFLTVLQKIEAGLEVILDVVKTFLSVITNPIRVVVTVILGLIRNMIAQIRATGFSFLFVLPDFSQSSIGKIVNSVSGGFNSFSSVVSHKLQDTSDINRPSYPQNSAAAMLVMYVEIAGAVTLFNTVMAIVRFFQDGQNLFLLPAPVDVTAGTLNTLSFLKPTLKALSLISSVESVEDGVILRWKMPDSSGAKNVPGLIGPAISIANSYRHPTFLIERTDASTGQGVEILIDKPLADQANAQNANSNASSVPTPKVVLKDVDGSSNYQLWPKRIYDDQFFRAGPLFFLSTEYVYFDKDGIERGKSYSYRVRAVSGDLKYYETIKESDITVKNSQYVTDMNGIQKFNYQGNNSVGAPSQVVRVSLPKYLGEDWPYPEGDIAQALMIGALCNFELPFQNVKDPLINANSGSQTSVSNLTSLQTGFGSLSPIGGPLFEYKIGKTSRDYVDSIFVTAFIKDVADRVVAKMYDNPSLIASMYEQMNELKGSVLTKVFVPVTSDNYLRPFTQKVNGQSALNYVPNVVWGFPDVSAWAIYGGVNYASGSKIVEYLNKEITLAPGYDKAQPGIKTDGPPPRTLQGFSAADRERLARFCRTCMDIINVKNQSLAWRTVSIGDLFPPLTKWVYTAERYVLNLLKALDDLGKVIEDIIDALVFRIQQLEIIVKLLIAVIDLLSVTLNYALLTVTTDDQGVDGLISGFQSSQNKPEQHPDALYLGIVMTAGGPTLSGFKALETLFGGSE